MAGTGLPIYSNSSYHQLSDFRLDTGLVESKFRVPPQSRTVVTFFIISSDQDHYECLVVCWNRTLNANWRKVMAAEQWNGLLPEVLMYFSRPENHNKRVSMIEWWNVAFMSSLWWCVELLNLLSNVFFYLKKTTVLDLLPCIEFYFLEFIILTLKLVF